MPKKELVRLRPGAIARQLQLKDMTQASIARITGFSTSRISQYVTGGVEKAGLEAVSQLAEVLGISEDEIAFIDDVETTTTTSTVTISVDGVPVLIIKALKDHRVSIAMEGFNS